MNVDTALAVAAETDGPENLELVALAPSDLLAAQTNLVNWCDQKTQAIHVEIADLRENLRIAKESKWRSSGLQSALNRAEKRVLFYDKIKAAVAAGYLIVPNFPVDLFAVRVNRQRPRHATATYEHSGAFNAKAELLPTGEGRYVDDRCFHRDESFDSKNADGSKKHVSLYVNAGFDEEVGFPVQAVKPVVLDATHRAMALRIFDELGTVQNQVGRDPIVVGRLIDPRGNRRVVTFFVAWWLNTKDL